MKNLLRHVFFRKQVIKKIHTSIAPSFYFSTTEMGIEFETVDMAALEEDIDAFSKTFKRQKQQV